MALAVADRVRETTTTTGTGTITLAGAVTGYQSFSAIGNGNTTYYTINAGSQWEVGIGTYTASGTTLSRDTVLASSNAGSLVNFSAGTKDVFATYPAGKAVYQDASGNVGIGTASPSAKLQVAGATCSLFVDFFGENLYRANQHVFGAADGVERMRIDASSTGNVGIGTSSPLSRLSVQQGADGFDQGFTLSRSGANRGTIFLNASDDTLNFGRATSTYMTLSSGGNLSLSKLAFNIDTPFYTGGNITAGANALGIGTTGAAQVGFFTNNSERMRIDSAGNVGIGTSSPGAKLAVVGTTKIGEGAASNTSKLMVNTLSGTAAGIQLFQDGNESWIIQNPASTTALTFANSGTERMRIDASGNVGIGTTAPSGYGKLAVIGGVAGISEDGATVTTIRANANVSNIGAYNATGAALTFNTNASGSGEAERMRITSTGNLGLGLSGPNVKFSMLAAASAPTLASASGIAEFRLITTQMLAIGGYDSGSYGVWLQGKQDNAGYTNTAFPIILQPVGGEVGIGIASPSHALDVYSAANGIIRVGGGNATNQGAAFYVKSAGSSSTLAAFGDRARIFGGTPDQLVSIFTGALPLAFDVNGSERARFDTSGNLGIGTSSPGAKLHVVAATTSGTYVIGPANVTSDLTDGTITLRQQIGAEGAIGTTGAHSLVLRTNNTERVRITSGGQLLSGTTTAVNAGGVFSTTGANVSTTATKNSNMTGMTLVATDNVNTMTGLWFGTGNGSHWSGIAGGRTDNVSHWGTHLSFYTHPEDLANLDNANEQMRLTGNGNLGIGSTAPIGKLGVSMGSATGSGVVSAWDNTYALFGGVTANAAAVGIGFNTSAGGLLVSLAPNSSWQTMNYHAANHVWFASGGEAMRVNTNSNVGIGTTAPASRLHVGSGYITAGSSSSTSGSKILAGEYSNAEHITTFGSEYSSGGPVLGYGVWPSTSASGAFVSSAGINISRGAYTISGYTHYWYGGGTQNVAAGAAVTMSERMRLDSVGNLGVGRVSPDARLSVDSGSLDVVATFNSTGNTYIQLQRSGAGHVYLQATAGAAYLWNQQSTPFLFGTSNTEQMRLTSSGQLFVGTNSISTKFAVVGYDATYNNTATFSSGLASQYLDILCGFALTNGTPGGVASNTTMTLRSSGGSAGELAFATGNTEQMRITSGGNVGIGTTAPGTRVEIKGANNSVAAFGDGILVTSQNQTVSTSYAWTGINSTSDLKLATGGTARLTINSSGGITSSDLADAVGYKGLPQNSQTTGYTLALSDMGKHISITTGNITIPANGSVAFPVGAAVTIFNNSGSTQTISITTDTLRQAGTTNTGTRTLAAYGVATVLKVASTTWVVSGNVT